MSLITDTHGSDRLNNIPPSRIFEEIEEYAIILLDVNGCIVNWNKGAERIKGYRFEEIVGQHIRVFYSTEDQADNLPEKMLQVAREFGKATSEGWRIKRDKSKFWGSITITAIHDDDKSIVGFTKVTRDLTTTKASQELLRKSEERYHKMIAEVQDYAIILLDTQGYIQNWNKGAEKIKGYTPDEIIGKHFSVFYTKDDQKNDLPQILLQNARENGRVQHQNWRVKKNGTLFWGFVTITSLHNSNGNVIGFSKVTRDLTEKKLAEEKIDQYIKTLQKKNKELEQFTYIASHDLQEPLRTISSFAELLMLSEHDTLSERSLMHLNILMQSAERMRNLVKGLLDYSRIGLDKTLTEIDCNVLIAEVKQDLHQSILLANAEVRCDKLPVITGYKTELQLIFQNLLSNAIKFRKKDSKAEVFVSAEQHASHWKFIIRDEGIGIRDRYKEKIFQIFQRLNDRNDFEGDGIGLAHSKKIVDLHGGEIGFESVFGEGSSFYFTIPYKIES